MRETSYTITKMRYNKISSETINMSLSPKIFFGFIPIALAYFYYSDNFDPASVSGKRVLVTGASAGIGEQVAYKYAQLGAKLVITARRKDLLEKVATQCLNLGAQEVHFIPADMSCFTERANLVEETERFLGGLDVLILNHAAYHYAWWNAGQDRTELLANAMEINFFSYVDITSRFLEALEESGGRIGVVSSVLGKHGSVGFSHYSATKHALQGFYSSLRQELKYLKKNISVTLIVYGLIVTEGTARISEAVNDLFVKYFGVSAEDAAGALVRAVSAGAYEVHFPVLATASVWSHKMFPEWVGDAMCWVMNYHLPDEPEQLEEVINAIYKNQ